MARRFARRQLPTSRKWLGCSETSYFRITCIAGARPCKHERKTNVAKPICLDSGGLPEVKDTKRLRHAAALDTVPKLLLRNATIHGSRPAMREKDLGIWQTWTWAQALDEVRALVDRPARARPEARRYGRDHRRQPSAPLLDVHRRAERSAPFRCRSIRTWSPTRWPTCSTHAEVAFAVVENQEQVDKVLSIADRVPTLRTSSTTIRAASEATTIRRLQSFAEVQAARPRGAAQATPASTTGGSPRSPTARAPTSRHALYVGHDRASPRA